MDIYNHGQEKLLELDKLSLDLVMINLLEVMSGCYESRGDLDL